MVAHERLTERFSNLSAFLDLNGSIQISAVHVDERNRVSFDKIVFGFAEVA